MKPEEMRAICWAALRGAANKETRRDCLPDGKGFDVVLRVAGELKTKPFACEIEARVAIGKDQQRCCSEAAPQAHLLAYVFSLMPKTRRDALLLELPEQFAEADERLPDVPAALVEAAENLLDRLRAKRQETTRGPVSVSYKLHDLTPGPTER
jgi:hypothetical protein